MTPAPAPARRRRGRPRQPVESRPVPIHLKVPPDLYDAFYRAAKRRRTNVHALVRRVMTDAVLQPNFG